MNNRLRKKVKARSTWKYYKSKRLALKKYPELSDTITDFWKVMKETNLTNKF